jgi:hypothetical protein
MNEQEFQAAVERIANSFRNRSVDAAVEERDRINRELAPENLYVDFQGSAGGNARRSLPWQGSVFQTSTLVDDGATVCLSVNKAELLAKRPKSANDHDNKNRIC